MKFVLKVLREQVNHIKLIFRLASYETKSKYQMHYLGILWQFLNPLLQVIVFWIVFGLGIRGGAPVGDTPFFVWLVIGLIPWFFISQTIVQGSNSVYAKVNLVSKMKFPVSILPSVTIVGNSAGFLVMLVLLGIILLVNNIYPTIYLLQFPYYLLCMYMFVFSFTLFSSTISIIIRDYQVLLQSMMRMLFFLTPIFWVPTNMSIIFQELLKLNPFYYIVNGFRMSLLGEGWVFQDYLYTIYFWSLTLFLILVGSFIHVKFRDRFVDYL
ncbi:teichoic acid ABC transporter permease [Alkalihalobacillus alcalophilus ATCC 27647 = CGMCC 1.3604]|uniref:Transport permease protein n=1 Tax=Alkalihalobacillus alcalophilus ATCC 27647 = CGMCC 1.3604 TaxID=1218173 RepID=J8TS76_ALKAL|nr:ABC transporter permease [Alkalihalobacillus alcalophilus]AFV25757.1 polysaccharide export transporter [Alkalihalobacillus alcalophilus ATCC 27647 = CGMCC 1.3604]KGA96885.1 Teichoic acid translocation permease TagG [Alkalihalobacillus alcalophilus ATCC 27647 = CGMCC 1.3604]MED1562649.1 ABC transporter permease [Alkalihalobacillus alcalophilus]THG88591.1 teichoic acid ABC transporter permease [Alkalihalobacillus alcalophilus ATCC 27647 = CGMCC 1.3604]